MILGLEVMILWYLKIFLTKETILQLGTVGGRGDVIKIYLLPIPVLRFYT